MDPYVYPGTAVLKNLRSIQDQLELSRFEADATSRRIRQVEHRPKPGKFDIPHLKAIHAHIFQDVYPWAGEFRTVNIARPGQFYFAFSEQIVPCLANLFAELLREKHLATTASREDFCNRAGYYVGEFHTEFSAGRQLRFGSSSAQCD
jgi:cell filamentation protein